MEGTCRVRAAGSRPKIIVSAGGRGVVGHAGARMLAGVAEVTGLTAACGDALAGLRQRCGVHDPGRVAIFVKEWRRLATPRDERVRGGEALAARPRLMDAYRRFLVLDPQLPQHLMPTGWPREKTRCLFEHGYDGLGERAEERVREILTAAGLDVPAGLGHHTAAQLSAVSWQAECPIHARDGYPEGGVRDGEDVPGGHDVQDGGAPDPGGVIEAHPVHDAGTAVVSDRGEGVEAEVRHHRDHGAFAVLGMVGADDRFRGAAVAAQIRQHDGVVLGQDEGDLMPHH